MLTLGIVCKQPLPSLNRICFNFPFSIFHFHLPYYSFGVKFSILNFQFSILFVIFVD